MPGPSDPAPEPASADARCTTPVVLVVGMAGSGKTTLVNALACYLEDNDVPALARAERASAVDVVPLARPEEGGIEAEPATVVTDAGDDDGEVEGAYVVNLDPAVVELPYEPNVDIRDTVKYKDVMREYGLGPNGAIITSLNLFATRFDQVLALVERRAPTSRAIVIDTPGQIETFTWSASGAIIMEALSMSLPTVVLFVVDTPRSQNAMTFVSNMLYACSIMYKTRLPMVIVFNKVDVAPSTFAEAWMRDFDAFDEALKEENFAGTLARSMAQALEEFYSVMRCASVSAATEHGMGDLMVAISAAAVEYESDYRPAIECKHAARADEGARRKALQLSQLQADLDSERAGPYAVRDRRGTWAPYDPLRRDGGGGDGDVDEDGNGDGGDENDNDEPKRLPSADWPGTGAEVGKGARTINDMRNRRAPPSSAAVARAMNDDDDDDDERERQELLAAEMQNPEDAKAYSDFVKYLQALNMTDDAPSGPS
jgi:GPN-loop GTPase